MEQPGNMGWKSDRSLATRFARGNLSEALHCNFCMKGSNNGDGETYVDLNTVTIHRNLPVTLCFSATLYKLAVTFCKLSRAGVSIELKAPWALSSG